MHTLHPHALRPRQVMGRMLQDMRGRSPTPAPRQQLQGPASPPQAAGLTSAGSRQCRCQELPREEMLRTGEDESRPPKREQGSSETVPAAEAALPFPFPSTSAHQTMLKAAGPRRMGRRRDAEMGCPAHSPAVGCPRLGARCHPHWFSKRCWKRWHMHPALRASPCTHTYTPQGSPT